MENLDAATIAELALQIGLLTPQQVAEAWVDLDQKTAHPEEFLRFMERKGYLTPWQSSKLVKQEREGYFLGGYRMLYKIASGSFGRVYRADDPRTARTVAIKVLRRKWTDNKHVVNLFEREGRMGMTLHHPNIVEILTVSYDPASHSRFIVMEFVEGGNLRDFMGIRKKLQPGEALKFIEECAAGMAFAFAHGVTHRDMKASNILISSQGIAKLVDFGLAGVRTHMREPENINVDRTVDYAGLELATSVPEGDTRSDIFFLGCVSYQMLTGRYPLEMGKGARARMAKERFANLKPISKAEVAIPSVIRLIDNMITLNPQQRFQTPSQLLEAVREVRKEVRALERPQDKSGLTKTVFIAERDESLQDLFREKFKEKGLRVLLAADPARAVDRFRQQPFDLLIVDAGTTGEEGLFVFERILNDARQENLSCGGVLMLAEEQQEWQEKIAQRPNQVVMVQPIKFKQLFQKVQEMLGLVETTT